MKIKLTQLKAHHLQEIGKRITNQNIIDQTGIPSAALTRYANGDVKRFNVEHADALTTFWRTRGYSLDDIWHFDEVEKVEGREFYGN